MKQLKVVIGQDQILSRMVQMHAYKLGYSWEIKTSEPMHLDSTRLFLCSDGFIYRNPNHVRNDNPMKLIDADDFLKMSRCEANDYE